MNDPITLDDLSAYLDDELSPARRSAVEAALAHDEALRAALDALAWTAGVVARAPLPDLPAGRSLRLPASERARGAPAAGPVRPGWRAAASLAAALAVVALASAVRSGLPVPLGGRSREAAAPVAVTAIAAEGLADAAAEIDPASASAPTPAGGDRGAATDRAPAGADEPTDRTGAPRAGGPPAAAAVLALLAAVVAMLALRAARTARRGGQAGSRDGR